MPIRRDYRAFYGREWRDGIRPKILKRAGGLFDAKGKYLGEAKCELCGAMDRQAYIDLIGFTRWVQIGVAHLDHDPGNNKPGNLKALCRKCHLNYDAKHHKQTRCARKDAARPLLQAVAI